MLCVSSAPASLALLPSTFGGRRGFRWSWVYSLGTSFLGAGHLSLGTGQARFPPRPSRVVFVFARRGPPLSIYLDYANRRAPRRRLDLANRYSLRPAK